MISNKAWTFCKPGLLALVENYDAAVADETQVWHLHHRLELTPGFDKESLMRKHIYYGCNPEALVFLTAKEHHRLHKAGTHAHPHVWTDESRARLSASHVGLGHQVSPEARRKISEARKKYWAQRRMEQK